MGCSRTDSNHFKSVRTILEDTVAELFGEIQLDYDPKLSANALMGDHTLQKVFEDARPFLEKTGKKYTICLSTDADIEMVENVNKLYPFDSVFYLRGTGGVQIKSEILRTCNSPLQCTA